MSWPLAWAPACRLASVNLQRIFLWEISGPEGLWQREISKYCPDHHGNRRIADWLSGNIQPWQSHHSQEGAVCVGSPTLHLTQPGLSLPGRDREALSLPPNAAALNAWLSPDQAGGSSRWVAWEHRPASLPTWAWFLSARRAGSPTCPNPTLL